MQLNIHTLVVAIPQLHKYHYAYSITPYPQQQQHTYIGNATKTATLPQKQHHTSQQQYHHNNTTQVTNAILNSVQQMAAGTKTTFHKDNRQYQHLIPLSPSLSLPSIISLSKDAITSASFKTKKLPGTW